MSEAGSGNPVISDRFAILDSGACPGLDPGFIGVTTLYEAILLQAY